MTGYVRTDTTNNIADGNVISAADLDNEFNGVQAAFNSSTGHTHDGSSAEGAPITKLGPVQDVTVSTTVLGVKTTNTVDLGTSSLKFKDFYLAGNASIGGTLGVTSTATFSGNTVLGDADTDTITQAASYVTGTQLKSAKTATNTLSLAAYDVDGTAYTNLITLTASNTPTLALTSTGVGTINNMSIGATTASTGAFTTLTSNGATTFTAGTASTTTGTGTLVITGGLGVSGRINAANFDGIVGANTAAAGSFTTLSATSTVSASSGGIQISAAGAERKISTDTVDGTDNAYIVITPGSSATTARGAYFAVTGNENSTFGNGGNVVITTGNVSGAKVKLQFNETDVAVVSSTGLAVTGTLSATNNISTANGYGYLWDTGAVQIYSNGTYMRFRTGSTDRMELTNTGLAVTGTLSSTGNATIGNAVAATNVQLTINGVVNKAQRIGFAESGVDKWLIGNGAASENGNFEIYDNTSGNNFIFTRTGRLGIGASPNYKLQVNGSLDIINIQGTSTNAFYRATSLSAVGDFSWGVDDSAGVGGGNSFIIYDRKNSAYRFIITNSGNIGMDTTSLSTWVGYKAFQNNAASLASSSSECELSANCYYNGGWKYYASNSIAVSNYEQYNGVHTWRNAIAGTAGAGFTFTTQMTLTAGGRLWVGAGATDYPLSVKLASDSGNYLCKLENTAAAPYGLYLHYSNAAPNSGTSEFMYLADNSAVRFYVKSNGGIGNYAGNNTILSDRREKTNFAPAKSYLDVICAIPVQTFNYIDQNMEEDGGLTLGVVAQDVQTVAPELVSESNWANKDEEPKMRLEIYQTDLQFALMKCIQELKAEIDSLKSQLNGA